MPREDLQLRKKKISCVIRIIYVPIVIEELKSMTNMMEITLYPGQVVDLQRMIICRFCIGDVISKNHLG